jgi:raffinose/stachyose/melibiose transport system substrate-binding protein
VLAAAAVVLAGGADAAGTTRQEGALTLTMLAISIQQPGYEALISNFERVYPQISVQVTYAPTSQALNQLETIELSAGSAPDLLATNPGCGELISVCSLAPAGDLAPLIRQPWAARSLPLVTSSDKSGQGLFAFTPELAPEGVFTDDALFSKLGLVVPRTFAQLLGVCEKAHAAGTAAVILAGVSQSTVELLLLDLAVATLYGQNPHWAAELRDGQVSFDGSSGWHQALQEFIDMNEAGCFQAGATGTSTTAGEALFAQGQGLMLVGLSSLKGEIDAASPQFGYSFYPLPGGDGVAQTTTFVNLSPSLGVNAHSSVENQAAAQTFIDFVARPKENALFALIQGGLTQYELLRDQPPPFLSKFAQAFAEHEYVINPSQSWWNAGTSLALQQDGIGLITGQSTVESVLQAMDAAWQQGPA